MMNALVAEPPLLTTRKYCPTTTSPSTLYLCHVLGHFYLMSEEGCSILAIAEALATWPGRRRTVCGIVFRPSPRFLRFCRVWSGPRWIIRTLLFLRMNTEKKFLGISSHEEHDVKTSASDVYVQYKIWMLSQPTN